MILLFRSERSIDDENRAVWILLGIFSYLSAYNLFIYKLVAKVMITSQVSCEYMTRWVIRIATAGALPIVIFFFLGIRFWNFLFLIPIRRCGWDHSTVRSRFLVEFRLRSLTVFVCVFMYHAVSPAKRYYYNMQTRFVIFGTRFSVENDSEWVRQRWKINFFFLYFDFSERWFIHAASFCLRYTRR